jgi:hypothetical protein
MAKSTLIPGWPRRSLIGGYSVHPPPTPDSTKLLRTSSLKLGGSNQKEKLFNRGKAISAHPSLNGISQFPNPPIKTGITKKKIIIKP